MNFRSCIVILLLFSFAPSPVRAQLFKKPYDTTYISRPQEKWILRTRSRLNEEKMHLLVGSEDGVLNGASISNGGEFSQKVGIGYRKLSVGIQLHPFGKKKSFGYDISILGNRIGINQSAGLSFGMSGKAISGDSEREINPEDVICLNASLSAYYAFNHKHFSMPAAINQSFRQRKSAGSVLATSRLCIMGLSFNNPDDIGLPVKQAGVQVFGLGGGYGYNWVPSEHWLIHASLTETVGFLNSSVLVMSGLNISHPGGPPVFMTKGDFTVMYYVGKCYLGFSANIDGMQCFGKDNSVYYLGRTNSNALLSAGIRF